MFRIFGLVALVCVSFAAQAQAQSCVGANADWTDSAYDTGCLDFDSCEKARSGKYTDFNQNVPTGNAIDVADALSKCGINPNVVAQALRVLGNAVGGTVGSTIIQQANATTIYTTTHSKDTSGRDTSSGSPN